jgi:hypothetical protein
MNHQLFYQWCDRIGERFCGLKKWQVIGLGLISYGIIKARRSQASLIAEELPEFGKASTVERRIQRWIANSRTDVQAACLSWMQWVLESYPEEVVYLLVDETKLSDRIGCMMVSLATQKRAIPLIWRCYRANSAADYPKEGQVQIIVKLLKQVLISLPKNKTLILQADRGIGNSSNLMREIRSLDVKFLFRVKSNSILTLKDAQATPLIQLAQPGQSWHGSGTLFTAHRTVDCEVHIIWDAEQSEPWCLATSLSGLTGSEYAFRIWQEESFRDLKSGGWQWQNNLIRNPQIMDRFLLPMALAYAWCVSLGLLFASLDDHTRSSVDCIRKHPKFCVFRVGLRFFKRFLFLRPDLIPFQLGPFPSPI